MSQFLLQDGLSIEILQALSFRTKLGLSLKNSLAHFEKGCLMAEIKEIAAWYDEHEALEQLALDYRVKSMESASHKYDRYFPNKPAAKVFNDLLGFRSLRDDYDEIRNSPPLDALRIVDMSQGKANDDGYRGVHVYYQLDNFHYPIEIQYNTYFDRQLNNWLHKYLYKKQHPLAAGAQMRALYEQGKIKNESEFQEELAHVLRCCEECQ